MGVPQSIAPGCSWAAKDEEHKEDSRADGGHSYMTVLAKPVPGARIVATPPL